MNPPAGYQEVQTTYPFKVARLKPGSFVIGRIPSLYYCANCKGWFNGFPQENRLEGQATKYTCRACYKELSDN